MTFPTKVTIYRGNDEYVELIGVSDGLSDPITYFNAGSATATLKDRAGIPVTGLTNVVMSYVAATDGWYRGSIPDTFNAPVGGGYTLFVDFDEGGVIGRWELPAEVKIRKS